MNEQKLIQNAQKNPKHFQKIYELYFEKVFRYFIARTGNTQLSEDLTSQTFLRVLTNLRKYKYEGIPFGGWLFRIAHNLLIDEFRRKAKNSEIDLENLVVVSEENIPEKTSNRLLYEKITGLLENFPREEREILLLKIITDLKFSDIARVIGKNENTVKTKYFRTFKSLKKQAEILSLLVLLLEV
jgi:RNA polymerase sigma-70 factor, ECF subfamily